jgi:hypothetical protein
MTAHQLRKHLTAGHYITLTGHDYQKLLTIHDHEHETAQAHTHAHDNEGDG